MGLTTIKIDLEKVYDCLSWRFIGDTLKKVGFLLICVNNIIHYVETSNMSIVWNDKMLDWFMPSRSIHQGNAISPYLFVFCVEKLGYLIYDVVNSGIWKPI